jgi:hypothetical protein
MKPEHAVRRTIIREWMSLPQDKRQAREQTEVFARKAIEKHQVTCSGDPYQRIMAWLLPRTGKA